MDRPFRELHELYKILLERAEAQAAAERERKEAEEAEREKREKAEMRNGVKPPLIHRAPPPDAIKPNNPNELTPSPLEAEALQDMMEEMSEGGIV